MSEEINQQARRLFAPLGAGYDRWSRILSFGQDPRWRRAMIDGLQLPPGACVLDVAAGTGMVAELLRQRGCHVVALDQSREMLTGAARKGFASVLANAESLPFADETFDALTFTYLLRYVSAPADCLCELARVVRTGGGVGMVEFGVPAGFWHPLWRLYTGAALPAVGSAISPGWKDVGSFLGPSIAAFHRSYPGDSLAQLWESAGLTDVRMRRMSLGGGLVMWGRRA
jgi:demethylmenaquinone methyltransferase/2-methoxy-6-polyprenyl-1,4-benzoquinol methylase